MKVWGVTGWKNSGKTGLMERLVAEFTSRGLTVSTVKHAHHVFDVDHKGKDSYRHREAGAQEVLLSSRKRWALMHEHRGAEEATLDELLAKLSPVDLVLVEGFKLARHPKVEAHRAETGSPLIAPEDDSVRAIASDSGAEVHGRPSFDLDDTIAIANFIESELWNADRFDSFAVVDWSSANDRGKQPKKDAIWAGAILGGEEQEPVYLRNRDVAFEWLKSLITSEKKAGRRLLIGFDFPFGYPQGFARQVTGTSDPLTLWAYYRDRLVDTPSYNSRFELAGEINARFPGKGPFWFNGGSEDVPDLPHKGLDRNGHGQMERRQAEEKAKGTFTCWQMGGAGAVGGQVMTGLAALQRLRDAFPQGISVWPFQKAPAPVLFVEIWPTLIDKIVREADDAIRDRAQVRLLTRALAGLPPDRLAAMLAVDAPEEGWILGLGYETELQEAACRN